MNISVLRRYALSNCVAAAMLSGCGGSQSPIGAQGSMPQNRAAMPQATHLPAPVGTARLGSLLAPQVSKRPVVYVAAGEVYVYPESPANSAPYGEIGSSQGVDGPWGLQVGGGSKGLTLYVANWGTNSVTAYYNRVYKKPDATYSYGVNRPMYVVVDSHSNLYISNANTGAVVEFPNWQYDAFADIANRHLFGTGRRGRRNGFRRIRQSLRCLSHPTFCARW